MKKILIAIPTDRFIEADTFKSVYDLEMPEGYEVYFETFLSDQIDEVRNDIAKKSLDYHYLFSVDSDIVLPKDALKKMLNADKPIVSGLYIQRIPNTHTLEVYMNNSNGGVTNIPYELIKDKGVVEIASCGMGCCLIKTEVFKNIEYPYFVYHSAIDHSKTMSEDIVFCLNARKNGFTVWADSSIICEHIGQSSFNVNTSELSHIEKIYKMDLLPKPHINYLNSMSVEPKIIYDIGACVMHWTRHAKNRWPNAKIYLVDAAKSVIPILSKSEYEWAVEVLSDEDNKEIVFYEDLNNPGGNSYYLENTGAFKNEHETKRITKTLNTLVKERNWPLPDLIKMDVQGAEVDVLKGASELLTNCNDIILEAQHTDYNRGAPKINEVVNYMNSIGFELVSNFTKTKADGDYHFRKKLLAN
jgi:FkbM family methyltransferase